MKNESVIITRTPLRVSFIGGGTDMPYFYEKFGGATISCAIKKYVYVTVKYKHPFNEKFRLNYSTTESVNKISEIKNDRIKFALKLMKINKPIYINTFSDIPSNSGLGSSSSFTVGLIHALLKLENKKISKKKIAELAFKIESEITNNSIGKQDHYIAAFGGIKFIEYKKKIYVKKIKISKNLRSFISNNYLIHTGLSRLANDVLKIQKKNKFQNFENLIRIKKLVYSFKNKVLSNKSKNLDLVEIIKQSWELKKKLSKNITNKKIEKLSKKLNLMGLIVQKLLGAGNGGFLLVFKGRNKKNITINNNKTFKLEVDNEGSKIL
tara:strand:+ start:206 stop:1174 length:969 start_codon:yes stop_codon:yes gene_type:complete